MKTHRSHKDSGSNAHRSKGPFFSPHTIFPRLTINPPNDKYEQEADAMAQRVMTMPEGDHIQRMCPECMEKEEKGLQGDQRLQRQVEPASEPVEDMEEEEVTVRRKSASDEATADKEESLMTKAEGGGMTASPALQSRLQSSKGVGAPLPARTNRFMSRAFGADFSLVRVHTEPQANEMNKGIQAKAFTHGADIYFRQGQYNLDSSGGKKLLAHELTHVVQFGRAGQQPGSLSDTSHPPVLQRRGSPPPAPTTEDCEPWKTTMLTNHLNNARTWVNDAERKIAAYAYVFASPRHSAVPRSSATTAIVRNALRDNFHTTSPGHVLAIKDNFASLRRELNRALTFECEDEDCTEDQAYVRGKFSWIRRLGDIHVCPPWFQCRDYFRRVTTLIHERAHQYPGATDYAYEWNPSYRRLTPGDAIDNAESYAVAARQIYHSGARGPGPVAC